jgi:glycosyltransferase involved in cell wall biosynthesis
MASFIGTMGLAHGLDTLVAAAERFQKTEPDILFMLVGDGADRERITGIARSKGLTNIRFVPQQLREKIPDYIALSDACLVLLKKSEVFETVIPTKMLEFMSCAKPVILGVAGQAREIIESSRAGICIEPENAEQLCEAILKLRNQEWLRESLGRNGRDYIIRKLSRERTADEYLQVLNEVIPQVRSSEAAVAA